MSRDSDAVPRTHASVTSYHIRASNTTRASTLPLFNPNFPSLCEELRCNPQFEVAFSKTEWERASRAGQLTDPWSWGLVITKCKMAVVHTGVRSCVFPHTVGASEPMVKRRARCALGWLRDGLMTGAGIWAGEGPWVRIGWVGNRGGGAGSAGSKGSRTKRYSVCME